MKRRSAAAGARGAPSSLAAGMVVSLRGQAGERTWMTRLWISSFTLAP
jgi:hypothetical protein